MINIKRSVKDSAGQSKIITGLSWPQNFDVSVGIRIQVLRLLPPSFVLRRLKFLDVWGRII